MRCTAQAAFERRATLRGRFQAASIRIAQGLFTIGHNMMISFAGLVKACLPVSRKHAQANAVAWRRFCELHHYFVGCVPQARTRLLKSNSRVRVGYAATHPTHETRPLRGSPCGGGAYSAELQTAPNRPTLFLLMGKSRATFR